MEGQDEVIREIETRLLEALGRFGVAGTVRIEQGRAVLEGHGPAVCTDVAAMLEQWRDLSFPERERACSDATRRLAAERRALAGPRRVQDRSGMGPGAMVLSALAVLGLLVAGALALSGYAASGGKTGAPANVHRRRPDAAIRDFEQYERDREARSARACASTSARVARGGTLGPTDTEGWVVEVALLQEAAAGDLSSDPALAKFVQREPGRSMGRFVWPEAAALAKVEGATSRVVVRSAGLKDGNTSTRKWGGVILSFTGKYVRPYFDHEQRSVYQRVANALARELDATHAGLYARCATSTLHQLGSWFQGPSPGGAAGAMVYFMGGRDAVSGASPDAGRPGGRRTPSTADRLKRIMTACRDLDRRRIATVLGAQNGMVSGPKGGPFTISFPFRDGNRATRSGYQVARFLGLTSAQ